MVLFLELDVERHPDGARMTCGRAGSEAVAAVPVVVAIVEVEGVEPHLKGRREVRL